MKCQDFSDLAVPAAPDAVPAAPDAVPAAPVMVQDMGLTARVDQDTVLMAPDPVVLVSDQVLAARGTADLWADIDTVDPAVLRPRIIITTMAAAVDVADRFADL